MGRKIDYTVVWATSRDINEAIELLRKQLSEKAEEGYKLLSGVSIAVDSGYLVVAQTLTKEIDAHD